MLSTKGHMIVCDNGKLVDNYYTIQFFDLLLLQNIDRIIYNSKEGGIMYIGG